MALASEKNRIKKVVHDANVKLSSVLTSLSRVSGQAPEVLQQALAELGAGSAEPKREGARKKGAVRLKAY